MFGSQLGGILGGAIGKRFGGDGGRRIGEAIGSVGGGFLPFEKGGSVKGKKGKPVKAILHSGEYVLPVGVKPTMAQKKAVAKGKKHKKPHM